jgi:hypothetical protein
MLNKFNFVFILLALPFLFANNCSKNKETNKNTTVQQEQRIFKFVVDRNFDYSANTSKYTIKEAILKDSILTLTIQLNACKDDVVDLVFNGNYLKSMPPKAQVGLRFNENNKCENNIIVRHYNIKELRYQGKTTIILLPSWQPITY